MKESWTALEGDATAIHQEKKNSLIGLTNNSSMLVWHFSRFILFMATRSCLGVQRAACTTAVAPLPGIKTTVEDKVDGSREEHKKARVISVSVS